MGCVQKNLNELLVISYSFEHLEETNVVPHFVAFYSVGVVMLMVLVKSKVSVKDPELCTKLYVPPSNSC